MLIQHITLLTGDNATHRLDTIAPEAVQACLALLPDGGQVPGFTAFRVQIVGPVFTLYRGVEPLVTCGIGRGHDGTWEALAQLQNKFAPVVAKPPKAQWLAVAILPGLVMTARTDIGWLADFERCMAAALLGGKPHQ